MTKLRTVILAGLGLLSVAGAASAQRYDYDDGDERYGRRGESYERRGDRYDDRYGDRGARFRDRGDEGFGRRGRNRDEGRDIGFDSREYLRCNPDVRRAVQAGQMPSAIEHFRLFGRREGRRLTC